MNLTKLIRNLESQLQTAEKYARQYDKQAEDLRAKLADVANIVGATLKSVSKSSIKAGKNLSRVARGLSAEGRARIIAAQRKRWAKFKTNNPPKAKSAKTGKAKLSAAGRAKIIAAQRKRWAAFRKTGASK